MTGTETAGSTDATRRAALFTAEDVCAACGGWIAAGPASTLAWGVSTDSRTVARAQAFFALVGDNHDAHRFVPQALAGGASVIVVEKRTRSWDVPAGVALVVVPDTTHALMNLAAWHRTRLAGTVVAVTGSCGKSTTKTMAAAIFSRTGRCTAAPKSFNNRIGLSLTLLSADARDEFVVLEMGTNHPGEIAELADIARPDAGLITCIGECHLEGLGTRHGVREAKAEMIPYIAPDGALMLNADDECCASLAVRFAGQVRTFGFSPDADVRAANLHTDGQEQVFSIRDTEFRLPLAGRHNVMNACAATCLAEWAGATLADARDALESIRLPELRHERREIGGVSFVLDCYNSNPTAMRAALNAFLQQPVARKRMVVCGDMLELGESGPRLHRHLGRVLALTRINTLVAVGPLGRHVVEGWRELAGPEQVSVHLPSADRAWRAVHWLAAPGDAVLIKGSRAMGMERIADELVEHVGATRKEAAA